MRPPDDPRLRWARVATLASLGAAVLTSLVMPGIGLFRETDSVLIALGAVGIGTVVIAQAGALYAAVTPWLSEANRHRLLAALAAAVAVSVPLVGPLGGDRWDTWAWLGGSVLGSAPMLVRPRTAALAAVAILLTSLAVSWWHDGSPVRYTVITVVIGLSVAGMCWLPVWLWGLLVDAQAGRAAQSRLVATEERLRFARDVHDLLGHNLSVIALKAELAGRLAPTDAGGAAREAGDVRRLAASTLDEMRQAVHGYRMVDLRDQITAIEQVLRSSGVQCQVSWSSGDLSPETATLLATVLREATTNLLRHSRASWCRIAITQQGDDVRMTVSNDGAGPVATPDGHSSGLRGLADRLAEAGGDLRTSSKDDVFTLAATLRAAR